MVGGSCVRWWRSCAFGYSFHPTNLDHEFRFDGEQPRVRGREECAAGVVENRKYA
jgi:hypothetical protein